MGPHPVPPLPLRQPQLPLRLYIDTMHARADFVTVYQDNNTKTYIPTTGESITQHALEEDPSYYPNLLTKEGNP